MTASEYQPTNKREQNRAEGGRSAERPNSDELGPESAPAERRRAPSGAEIRRATGFVFVVIILIVLIMFSFFAAVEHSLADPDLYWHTAAGRLIWTSGALPQHDVFSHSFRGHPWIARDWLADLAFYGSYSLVGWRGLVILVAVSTALTFGLLFLALARTMRITVAVGVTIVMIPLSIAHIHARTQLLADPLLVMWIAGLVRAVDTKTSPSWLLLPVMALWANIHGGFIVGLGLGVGLAGEALIEGPRGERRRLARRWSAFLLAAVAASCLTPYTWKPLVLNFTLVAFGNEAAKYIQEYQPVSMGTLPTEMILILLLMGAALWTGVRIRLPRLGLIAALTVFMLSAVRYAGPYNFVMPLFLAAPICAQFPSLSLSRQIDSQPEFFITLSRIARRWLYPLYATVFIIPLSVAAFGRNVPPDPRITPEAAVDYLVSHNNGGNVYNSYGFGGYLTFRGVPTIIDGRTDQLFLNGFISRWSDASQHPKRLASYLAEFKIKFALLEPHSLEAEELEADPNWRKVFEDKNSVLFERAADSQ